MSDSDWCVVHSLCRFTTHQVVRLADLFTKRNVGPDVQRVEQLDRMLADLRVRQVPGYIARIRIRLIPSAAETPDAVHALKNCRLLAAKQRGGGWGSTILRFCANAGVVGSPFRGGDVYTVEESSVESSAGPLEGACS